MKLIAKRVSFYFTVGLVFFICLIIGGVIFLFATDDGSTTIVAIIMFVIGSIFLIIGLIDKIKHNSKLIYTNNDELIIHVERNIELYSTYMRSGDSKYIYLKKSQIKSYKIYYNESAEMEKSDYFFGILGYIVRNFLKDQNGDSIYFTFENGKNLTVCNIYKMKHVESALINFLGNYKNHSIKYYDVNPKI